MGIIVFVLFIMIISGLLIVSIILSILIALIQREKNYLLVLKFSILITAITQLWYIFNSYNTPFLQINSFLSLFLYINVVFTFIFYELCFLIKKLILKIIIKDKKEAL